MPRTRSLSLSAAALACLLPGCGVGDRVVYFSIENDLTYPVRVGLCDDLACASALLEADTFVGPGHDEPELVLVGDAVA
jgi:hypothetical protein